MLSARGHVEDIIDTWEDGCDCLYRTEVTRVGFSGGVCDHGNEPSVSLKAYHFWYEHSSLLRPKFTDLYSVRVKASRQKLRISNGTIEVGHWEGGTACCQRINRQLAAANHIFIVPLLD
jgi:hypothetical protein